MVSENEISDLEKLGDISGVLRLGRESLVTQVGLLKRKLFP